MSLVSAAGTLCHRRKCLEDLETNVTEHGDVPQAFTPEPVEADRQERESVDSDSMSAAAIADTGAGVAYRGWAPPYTRVILMLNDPLSQEN